MQTPNRISLLLLALGALFISACGQKGPLFIPEDQRSQEAGTVESVGGVVKENVIKDDTVIEELEKKSQEKPAE